MNPFLIFLVSAIATGFSSLSGAGKTLITVPIWLAMGIPPIQAIFSEKISDLFQCPLSAWNYLKSEKIDWTFV